MLSLSTSLEFVDKPHIFQDAKLQRCAPDILVYCLVVHVEQHHSFQKQKRNTMDINQLSTALTVLKHSPELKAVYLIPLLINAVPDKIVLDWHQLIVIDARNVLLKINVPESEMNILNKKMPG